MSQTFVKEKPSALYLVDQSEIRGRIPLEKRRERNAADVAIASAGRTQIGGASSGRQSLLVLWGLAVCARHKERSQALAPGP